MPLLRKVIAAQPEKAAPHCELAAALHSLGQDAAALTETEVAIHLEPEFEWPHRLRSIILRSSGRTEDAVAAARQSVRLAPIPETLHTLGAALLAAGKIKEAAEVGEALVRVAPGAALSHQFVGLVAIRRKDWKRAEAASQAALRIDPVDQASLNNLGVAYQGQRRWRDALETYQRAAQLDPTDEVAKQNIVRLVRPVSGQTLAIDMARAAVAPWIIPIIVGQNLWRFAKSRRRQRELKPGAALFYQREAWRDWPIDPRLLLAALTVWILGVIAIIIAESAGWRYVYTGVPMAALTVGTVLIALSGTIVRGVKSLAKRFQRKGQSQMGTR